MFKHFFLMIGLIAIASAQNFKINFFLYTKSRPEPTQVTEATLGINGFSLSKKTIFLAHGFTDGIKTTTMIEIITEILKREDVNAIFVDWSEGAAAPNYYIAASNVVTVGKRIAEFMKTASINPSTVHCIGHSLGSHVCGNAGRPLKLRRISAMDPAGPFFPSWSPNRLTITNADFVDAIHTDKVLGYNDPLGHIDFYPNGGQVQPGCQPRNVFSWEFLQYNLTNPVDLIACSHARVIKLYAESVRLVDSKCKFQSVACSNYENFKASQCNCLSNGCALMGYYADKTSTKNNFAFYLDTTAVAPYCLK